MWILEVFIYFKDLSMVKNIFQKGIKEFEEEMQINTLFFIGQYGYKNFIEDVRVYAKDFKNIHIRAIWIQALGDLKDYQSIAFIYQILPRDSDEYLKEICVETYYYNKTDGEQIVYRELCRYVAENNKILRRDKL